MMTSLGHGASATAVAGLYQDFSNVFVLDDVDRDSERAVAQLGMRALVCPTMMTGMAEKEALARAVMEAATS